MQGSDLPQQTSQTDCDTRISNTLTISAGIIKPSVPHVYTSFR
jgi:hypothetical protein